MTEVPGSRPPGTPCRVSLMVHRLDAAREFYGNLFGWEFREGLRPLGSYVRAMVDGRPVAALSKARQDRRLPFSWTPLLACDDADATAGLILERGGTVGVGPLDVDGEGRIALAVDPSGAVFGIWQALRNPGADVPGGPGTLAWNELVARESSQVGKFYAAVFGLDAQVTDIPGRDYLTLHQQGRPVAGIHGVGLELPRDRGAHWLPYFAVANTDAACRRVGDLGGKVLQPAQDSPYGRVASVTDREGAVFALIDSTN